MASGPRVKLAGHKSALNPLVVYSTDRSKAVVPVLVLFFVALCFILRGDLLYVLTVLVVFGPLSIATTSLWEERAYLSAFRTFVRVVLVWFYRFPLPLGVWKGQRFVIVALPGLFFYLFVVVKFSIYLNRRVFVMALNHNPIKNILGRARTQTSLCISRSLNGNVSARQKFYNLQWFCTYKCTRKGLIRLCEYARWDGSWSPHMCWWSIFLRCDSF